MASSVKNIGREATQVGIILEDGRGASIRLMPRSRKPVPLPPGSKLDPNWMALHGANILEFTESQLQQAVKDQEAKLAAYNSISTASPNVTNATKATTDTAATEEASAAQTVTSKT